MKSKCTLLTFPNAMLLVLFLLLFLRQTVVFIILNALNQVMSYCFLIEYLVSH